MTFTAFELGDKIFFSRVFTKATGQSGNPVNVTVVLTVKDPAGATSTPTVTANTVNGVTTATADLTVPALNTSAGVWHARWVCSVDLIAVEEEAFFVHTSPVLA